MSTQPVSSVPEVHHLSRKPIDVVDAEAIVVSQPPQQLAMQRAPELVLQEAAKAAQALKEVIESKPNKVVINGRTFLTFEDWQTLGRFYGITVAARATSYIEQGRVRGYECHAEAIRADGQVIGAAQAMCMDDEQKWHDKPLYQLRSMAQTRAQAKALRGVLAWVAVMAGYNPTPAEEMDGAAHSRSIPKPANYTPMHPDRVRKLCFAIDNSKTIEELQVNYFAAYREAKTNNDDAARSAFVSAKDERKRKLSGGAQ